MARDPLETSGIVGWSHRIAERECGNRNLVLWALILEAFWFAQRMLIKNVHAGVPTISGQSEHSRNSRPFRSAACPPCTSGIHRSDVAEQEHRIVIPKLNECMTMATYVIAYVRQARRRLSRLVRG
jgi:hypothetical protein